MKNITPQALKKRLDQGDVTLIDVREPIEYKTAYIEGAHLIPLAQVTREKLPVTDKPLVLYCRSGRRSMDACQKLFECDSSLDLYSLDGGIIAWQEAGCSVKKSGENRIPLERQTQCAIGSIALVGTVLGALTHPLFYVVPGFIGAGLIFAGVTGWCGMAQFLSTMPWNQSAQSPDEKHENTPEKR